MHWSEDGKIEITRNFAIGTAASGRCQPCDRYTIHHRNAESPRRDREPGIAVPVTPTILANEQGIETTEQEKGTLQPSANQQKTVDTGFDDSD